MPFHQKLAQCCVDNITTNEIIGVITVILTIVMYVLYIKDTTSGKIKPHPFSWFLWLLITATIFLAQLSDGAGPGAWMNGAVTFFNVIVFSLSIKNGIDVIKKIDLIVLGLAIISIILWLVTSTPLFSVILLTIALNLAFIPTLRKAYHQPFEESMHLFTFGFFRHGLTILAMDNLSIITTLSPAVLVLDNLIVAAFIL